MGDSHFTMPFPRVANKRSWESHRAERIVRFAWEFAWEVMECGSVGSHRIFCVVLRVEISHRFFAIAFFQLILSINSIYIFRQFPTIFTMTKKLIYRQNSTPKICQILTNFLRFDFSIEWTKFRQTLYFRASHYYYMPIIPKVYLFLFDKFRSALLSFFKALTYIIV